MKTTVQQDREFISDILPTSLLEESAEWITSRFTPLDLYGKDDLIDFVASEYYPSDVFHETDLEKWALENGFTK